MVLVVPFVVLSVILLLAKSPLARIAGEAPSYFVLPVLVLFATRLR